MKKVSRIAFGWIHVGMEIDFHHPDSDSLDLTEEIEDLYGALKEEAPIFLRVADGNRVSAEGLLAERLAGIGKTLPDVTAAWGAAGTLVLDYPPGRYALETKAGSVEVRRVRLAFRRRPEGALH